MSFLFTTRLTINRYAFDIKRERSGCLWFEQIIHKKCCYCCQFAGRCLQYYPSIRHFKPFPWARLTLSLSFVWTANWRVLLWFVGALCSEFYGKSPGIAWNRSYPDPFPSKSTWTLLFLPPIRSDILTIWDWAGIDYSLSYSSDELRTLSRLKINRRFDSLDS